MAIRAIKCTIVALTALFCLLLVSQLPFVKPVAAPFLHVSKMIAFKAAGRGSDCPWDSVLQAYRWYVEFRATGQRLQDGLQAADGDASRGLIALRPAGGTRTFWIRQQGDEMDGAALLTYLLADHEYLAGKYPANHVRPADVVIDCGSHVGVFADLALRRGASKVIAIEPDPTNVECLRRNFKAEISEGRVVVVPKGVWDTEGILELSESHDQSGSHSFVRSQGHRSIAVHVTTIDLIARQLGLERADFIKMDIEGAERKALAGARETLRRFKPRLMIDSYHLPDDPLVLRSLLIETDKAYRAQCSFCELDNSTMRVLPHVIFWNIGL